MLRHALPQDRGLPCCAHVQIWAAKGYRQGAGIRADQRHCNKALNKQLLAQKRCSREATQRTPAAKKQREQSVSLEKKKEQEEKRKVVIEKAFKPEDFSLPTAVALGCCSFEAYNAPYKSYGLKEVSACGTETVFMDRDFLSGQISGILEVHLRRAVHLPKVDLGNGEKGLPNSRCRVAVSPSSGFSERYERSVDPFWRQTFFLYVRDLRSQALEVFVEHVTDPDEDDNILLGTAAFENLSSLCDCNIHNLSLTLEGEEQNSAIVELSVKYQPHTEESNLLDSIKQQAVSQMITDDWSAGEHDEWDTVEADFDWRFSGVPTRGSLAVMDEDNPVDLEGGTLAEGQPLDRAPWKDWSKLRETVIGRQLFTSLTPLLFLLNKKSDTEVWIYRSTEKKQIAISFRGTSTPKDMLTDMALDLAAFNPAGKGKSKAPEQVAEELSDEELENGPFGGLYKSMKALEKVPGLHLLNEVIKRKGQRTGGRTSPKGLSGWAKAQIMMLYANDAVWVHKGFLQAYMSVSDVIHRTVDDILAAGTQQSTDERSELQGGALEAAKAETQQAVGDLAADNGWHVYVTGHSLGGALATLCAHELAVRDYKPGVNRPAVTMYSFGSPRIGNKPFAESYDAAVPDSWRVKNADDLVTRVPSLLGYQHVGCEVNLFPHGKVSISGASTDDIREGAVLTDIIPKIQAGLLGDDEELKQEFQELVKGEIEVFKAIIQGQGVSQHMEDIYHLYLNECSQKGPEYCQPVVAAIEDAKREAKEHMQQLKQKGPS